MPRKTIGPEEELSIRLDGMVTEAMKRTKQNKAELSRFIGLGPEALKRMSTDNELWKLSGHQILLLAEASGRWIDFPTLRR